MPESYLRRSVDVYGHVRTSYYLIVELSDTINAIARDLFPGKSEE
jgi:hypothetical protein